MRQKPSSLYQAPCSGASIALIGIDFRPETAEKIAPPCILRLDVDNCNDFSLKSVPGVGFYFFTFQGCFRTRILCSNHLSTLIILIKYLKCLKNAENLCAEWRYFAETRNPSDGWTVSSLNWQPKPSLRWPALLSITFLTPSAVINLCWIWALNSIMKKLVWFCAFVCVMLHWSSFLHFRVFWRGHCD